MKSFVRSTTARPGVGPEPRGPAGQPAPEPEQNQVEPFTELATECLHRPTPTQSPITPSWEKKNPIITNHRSHSIPMTLCCSPSLPSQGPDFTKRQKGCVGEQRAALAHLPHI
ncbi:hypothetical protein PAMA_006037 [Pampus argenteus]